MRKAEIVMAGLFALMSVYLMWKSGQVPSWSTGGRFSNIWYSDEGVGDGFWPFWLALIMLLCCIWIAINWVRRTSPPSQSEEVFLDRFGVHMLITVGGGLMAFVGLSVIISMYFSMALFLVYFIRFLGRHRWMVALPVAIIMPVVTFLFFEWQMRVVLPKGYAEPLFLPLYDIFLDTSRS